MYEYIWKTYFTGPSPFSSPELKKVAKYRVIDLQIK